MRTAGRMLIVVLLLAAWTAHAPASAQQVMHPDEIETGMKGHGLASLKEGPPHRFDFTVLGVQKGWDPKSDLVLIRMSGPIVDEAGIISGMSGSPCYIDGKLIGAVAYGWSFTKIPLAGVQPIGQMLKVRDIAEGAAREEATEAPRAQARQAMRRLATKLARHASLNLEPSESRRALREYFARHAIPRSLAHAADSRSRSLPLGMRPLPLPVSLRMPEGSEAMGEMLRRAGLMPVQATSAGNAENAPDKLVPGGPVAVSLISGDIDIAGSGTVTWVDGDEILAFGHPMFGMGETSFPLATATPVTVVPSLASSFRLTNTGKTIGALTHDHSPAIRGMVGQEAPSFPMQISVQGNLPDDYSYTVAGHWDWGPFLATLAASWTVGRWDGGSTPINYKVRTAIRLEGRDEPITMENEYTGYSAMTPLFDQIYMPAGSITANPFEEVDLAGVDVSITIEEGMESASIQAVKLLQPEARPGEEVQLDVRLQPWRGEETTRRASITIPKTARPGTEVRLLVCDAWTSRMIDRSLDPGLHRPENLDQLIRSIEQDESNRNMVVRANVIEQGMRYDGHAMPALPPSVTSVIRENRAGATAMPLASDVKTTLRTDWILSGRREVSVRIVEPQP